MMCGVSFAGCLVSSNTGTQTFGLVGKEVEGVEELGIFNQAFVLLAGAFTHLVRSIFSNRVEKTVTLACSFLSS